MHKEERRLKFCSLCRPWKVDWKLSKGGNVFIYFVIQTLPDQELHLCSQKEKPGLLESEWCLSWDLQSGIKSLGHWPEKWQKHQDLVPAPVLWSGCFGCIPLEITEGIIQGARLWGILKLLEVIIFWFYYLSYKQHELLCCWLFKLSYSMKAAWGSVMKREKRRKRTFQHQHHQHFHFVCTSPCSNTHRITGRNSYSFHNKCIIDHSRVIF